MNLLLMGGCDYFVSADQRVERARAKTLSGDDGAAVIELKKALKSDAGNAEARLMLIELATRLGDLRTAEEELKVAQQSGAQVHRLDRAEAELLLARGKFDDLLAASERLRVSDAEKLSFRAQALKGLGRIDEAAQVFEQSLAAEAGWAPAQIGLAEIAAARGDSEGALVRLSQVLKQDSKNAIAWFMQGSIFGRRGDFPQATESLEQSRKFAATRLSSTQYNLLLIALVESYLGQANMDSARRTLNDLSTRTGGTPLTRVLTARIAMAEGDYSVAAAEAQKAVAEAPQLAQAKLLVGAALMAQGNFNQAEAHLADLVRSSPENVEARKLLAQLNLKLQRPDAAAQVLAPLQETDASDPQLAALLGMTSLQQGQSANAIAILEKGIAAQPNNASLKLDLATAYMRAGRTQQALELLRAMPSDARDARRDVLLIAAVGALEGPTVAGKEIDRYVAQHADDAAALTTAAELHGRFGNVSRARELLDRALTVQPGDEDASLMSAELAASARDWAKADTILQAAVDKHPDSSRLKIASAKLSILRGEEDAAMNGLQAIRKADPKATEASLLLAQIYAKRKQFADVDRVIAEALRGTDNPAAVHAATAQLYLAEGKYDSALSRFREAANADPKEPSHVLGAARTQLALGNRVAARESVESALRAHPTYVPAVALAVTLDLRDGKQEAANSRVDSLAKQSPNNPAVAMLRGDVLLASKAFEPAAQAYAAANKRAPSTAGVLREYRARTLGRLANPTAPLEEWLRAKPGDVTVRLVLAEDLATRGQNARAIREYEMLAQSQRPNAMALNNLAWLYHQAKDSRAIATAEEAARLAPNVAAIADTLGWILVESGDLARGTGILKQAASADPNPEIRYHYAMALAQGGDTKTAREEFEAIVKLAPSSTAADRARQWLSRVGG